MPTVDKDYKYSTFAWIRLFLKNICIKQSGDICLQSWCGSKRPNAVPIRGKKKKVFTHLWLLHKFRVILNVPM